MQNTIYTIYIYISMITSYPLTLSDISISIGSHLPIRPVVVDKAPHLCSSVKVGIRACAQRTT